MKRLLHRLYGFLARIEVEGYGGYYPMFPHLQEYRRPRPGEQQ